MRDRIPKRLPEPIDLVRPASLVRKFQPVEADLDDLTEAIRNLLGGGTAAVPSLPDPHLLSRVRRVSHVVGDHEA